MSSTITPANFTRRTADLPAKFRRQRQFALIPLYHLLRRSDLAREGIEYSGSFRFADHIYRNEASGHGWFGRLLDRRLLDLPASQAFRSRYTRSRDEMHRAFSAHVARSAAPFRILTVPCGLPRDVREFAEHIAAENPERLRNIEYHGMDLDPAVVEAATAFLADSPITAPSLFQGNALEAVCYGAGGYHFIASTGLGEFLNDEDLATFYGAIFRALAPGGTFYTSATAFEKRSDAMLRAFELNSFYRTQTDLERLLSPQPWASVEFSRHDTGLQTYVRAVKR